MGKEQWSPDVRYGKTKQGPEADARDRNRDAVDTAADRLIRERQAEDRAAGK